MSPTKRRLLRRVVRIASMYAVTCAVFFLYGAVQGMDDRATEAGNKLMRERIAKIK
jgi:peptidoglycan/LPS O-acetylase OafA/YrhL